MNRNRGTRMKVVNGLSLLLETKTIADIRISDVCEKSGVSRATFYRYFYNVTDVAFWLWDECNYEHFYKMGNPYGWRQAHLMQFSTVLKYKTFFMKAFTNNDYDSVTVYSARKILRNLAQTITEVKGYEMNDQEQFELEYYVCGCSYMFSKWAREGMLQSPEQMTEFFGHSIPIFFKKLCEEPS